MGNCVSSSMVREYKKHFGLYKRVYFYGAGEDQANGCYKILNSWGWRNDAPAYKNSCGYTLSYEVVNGEGGWMIGMLNSKTAFYGIKTNSRMIPSMDASWLNFDGLEPAPKAAFTRKAAEKVRAELFHERVIQRRSAKKRKPAQPEPRAPKSPAIPKTARAQFETNRNEGDNENLEDNMSFRGFAPRPDKFFQNNNLPQKYHRKFEKVVHSPFKPRSTNNINSEITANPIRFSSRFEERVIDTKCAREEKMKIEMRKQEARAEAAKFQAEQEAYMAQVEQQMPSNFYHRNYQLPAKPLPRV